MPANTQLHLKSPLNDSEYVVLNVNIESYSAETVLADDQMTPQGSRYSIVATGLLPVATWAAWEGAVGYASTRLEYARMPSTAPRLIDLESGTSMIGGPFCKITGTQIAGSTLVFVRVELNDQVAACAAVAVTHTWTQRMSLDAKGHFTRTINGMLKINKSNDNSNYTLALYNSWTNRAPWADIFRQALIPSLPAVGWRRESQEFYYDPTSTALGYVIVDRNTRSDLPDGVRIGDMDFTYERSLENVGVATLRFTCDLQGDLSLMTIPAPQTGNRKLIEAAIGLSKTKINAQYQNIIITRMAITEREMLTGYAIRFELDAQCYPQQETNSNAMVALAYMVGAEYRVIRTEARTLNPYGPAIPSTISDEGVLGDLRHYAMVPHYYQNLLSGMDCTQTNMPQATMMQITDANVYGALNIAVIAPPANTLNTSFSGKFSSSQAQGVKDIDGYTTIVGHNVSITNVAYTGGFVRLNPMLITAPEIVLQIQRPRARVSERIEIARVNSPPAKVTRPMPTNAFLVSDEWNVTYGKYDAQGQRVFTGVYNRIYEVYDGDASTGFANVATAFGTVTEWGAPTNNIRPAISPYGTTASQSTGSSVFDTAGATDAYSVPQESFLT